MPRKMDFEEPGRQKGPFRTQLWLSRHPLYVYVLGADLEAPEEVQGLIGLTHDVLGLSQSLDADLAGGEEESEEGLLFLANSEVKNYHINRMIVDEFTRCIPLPPRPPRLPTG